MGKSKQQESQQEALDKLQTEFVQDVYGGGPTKDEMGKLRKIIAGRDKDGSGDGEGKKQGK